MTEAVLYRVILPTVPETERVVLTTVPTKEVVGNKGSTDLCFPDRGSFIQGSTDHCSPDRAVLYRLVLPTVPTTEET